MRAPITRHHRIYRGKTGLLCVCRSADSTTSKPGWRAFLSTDCTKRMGGRVSVLPTRMETTTAFCPDSLTDSRGTFGTTASVSDGIVYVSSLCHQSCSEASEPLALLRATAELIIKDFAANEAFFQIVLLAYNLINWFKRLCDPPHWQRTTLRRMRQQLLVVPAELVRPAGVPTLRIAPCIPKIS